jgi:shikimate kinase
LPAFLRTENPRETHRVLHERRGAAYFQFADIVIEAERKTPEEVARDILNCLN